MPRIALLIACKPVAMKDFVNEKAPKKIGEGDIQKKRLIKLNWKIKTLQNCTKAMFFCCLWAFWNMKKGDVKHIVEAMLIIHT